MTADTDEPILPPENRERLIYILHPKRASFIINYVVGATAFIIGLAFFVASSGQIVEYSLYAWILGNSALIFAVVLVSLTEARRRYTLYIITTWNLRVRTGYFRRKTHKIYLDEIGKVEITAEPEERVVGMGNVEIFKKGFELEPDLIFTEIHNPDGIRELILRLIKTTPDVPEWAYIDHD
ncbi:MAG: PH domain-containing protein [Candidatus Thorarchaeota archaeon]|nr:MAG: PH domain-containing protein [Candidatus Thorarchaeota archaeon]